MIGYSQVEISIALVCAFLAVLHLTFWRLSPKDRLQLWIGLLLLAMAAFNAGLGGSSGRAGGSLGSSTPWLLLAGLASVAMWPLAVLVIWGIAEVPLARAHKAILAVVVLASLGTGIKNVVFVSTVAVFQPSTWEDMTRYEHPLGLPELAMLLMLGVWLWEAARAAWRRRAAAWVLIAPGLPSVALGALEAASESSGAPTLVGMIGLPIVLMSSFAASHRYVQAVRRQEHAGDYRLIRRLAGGGMGELFLATKRGPGGFERPVALKRVLQEGLDEKSVERLLAEARTAARLVHPNIVAVHDVGRLGATPGQQGFGWFIAMEYLPGVNLLQVRDAANARTTLLPPPFVAVVGHQICRGLAHAHAHGIVHRDISPHNVMVTFDGAVKIVDFGVATHPASDAPGGYIFGKVAYSSPEHLLGHEVTPASDVFSVGIVLYELLAGVRPFRGENAAEIAAKVLRSDSVPLSLLRPEVPPELARIVGAALSKAPADRPASAEALASELERIAQALGPVDPGRYVRELCSDAWQEHQAGGSGVTPLPAVADPQDAIATRRL